MTTSQPRQPKGQPTGGEFAGKNQSDDQLTSLAPPKTNPTRKLIDKFSRGSITKGRLLALARSRYVPSITDVTDQDRRDPLLTRAEWFDQHYLLGEHSADIQFPKMVEDDNRQRRTYRGSGMSLKMPSARWTRAFADEAQGTFDVPFSATDDRTGETISGWCRVTNTGPAQWSVQTLGTSGFAASKVSEAMSAVLEARRVTMGLAEAGDLIEKHNERLEAQGSAGVNTAKSWIKSVGFLPADGVVVIRTVRGDVYGYDAREKLGIAEALVKSRRPGALYNEAVKGQLDRVDIIECPTCSRVYHPKRNHRCPNETRVGNMRTGRSYLAGDQAIWLAKAATKKS